MSKLFGYGLGIGLVSGSGLSWYLCNKNFNKIFKTKTTENNIRIYYETLGILNNIEDLKGKIKDIEDLKKKIKNTKDSKDTEDLKEI